MRTFSGLYFASPVWRCPKGKVPLHDVIGWHHRLRKKWLTSGCSFLKQGKPTFSLQRALHPHKLKFNILAYFVTALVLNNQYITWIFLTFLQFDTKSSCVVREIYQQSDIKTACSPAFVFSRCANNPLLITCNFAYVEHPDGWRAIR